METAELILHPIRLRILVTLAGRRLTVQQMAQAIPDVPQATLYRHVNALAEGGVLDVVEANPVRGTLERVYALPDLGAISLPPHALDAATNPEHLRFFTAFVALLLAQFSRYLASAEQVDAAADGLGYHTIPLYLSDAELRDFDRQLSELLQAFTALEAGPERRRRHFSTVLIPEEHA